MLQLLSRAIVVIMIGLLTACATPRPPAPVDKERLSSIKSIAVMTPPKASYLAYVGAPPSTVFVNSVGTAAMSGAIGGLLVGYSQGKASGFDAYVKNKLPDVDLNRELVETVKADLSRRGYAVQEFLPKTTGSTKPATEGSAEALLELKPDHVQTDAILVLMPMTAYQAPGPLNSYTRQVFLTAYLVGVSDRKMILSRGYSYHKHFSDDYSYNTYNGMTEDADKAIDGLRKALLGFVPSLSAEFDTASAPRIQASR